jgi:hypothetical protein
LTLAAVLSGCGVQIGSSGPSFKDVRICGPADWNADKKECEQDESSHPIRARVVYCSASYEVPETTRFTGGFLFEGRRLPVRRFEAKRSGTVYTSITLGPVPLPGGRWTCDLRFPGVRVRKPFRSGGDAGPIVYLAACATTDTVVVGGNRVCRDRATGAVAGTRGFTCSAVLAGAVGDPAALRVVFQGKPTPLALQRQLRTPVSAVGVQLTPPATFPRGRYRCEWTVAGERRALAFRLVR